MTKIAVAEFETQVRTAEQLREFHMWEPQTDFESHAQDSGMVLREQNVFEDFQTPCPRTTQEAVEDDSTHKHNDETQIYSIQFIGKNLIYCPKERPEKPSIAKMWHEQTTVRDYKMACEGVQTKSVAHEKVWEEMAEELRSMVYKSMMIPNLYISGRRYGKVAAMTACLPEHVETRYPDSISDAIYSHGLCTSVALCLPHRRQYSASRVTGRAQAGLFALPPHSV